MEYHNWSLKNYLMYQLLIEPVILAHSLWYVILRLIKHLTIFFFVFPVIHWLVMTAWVIWQDTDFCRELWEERLYNAVVGVIYCFCFFNLKEGKSRYRATIFYAIILVENFAFLSVFYFWTNPEDYYKDETFFKLTFVTVIFILETASIAIGLTCMLLYYRYDIYCTLL